MQDLSRLCLETIAQHLRYMCSNMTVNTSAFRFPKTTLVQLNENAMQQILDIGISTYFYNDSSAVPQFFSLIIHEDVLKLDLNKYKAFVTDQLLLKLQCKKLVHLNLMNCSQISLRGLNHIINQLTSLTCINLSHCPACSNSSLLALAANCPNLKELDLESCGNITDDGIKDFCDNVISKPKLWYLNLSATSVTTKILTMVLNHLPMLAKLSFCNIKSPSVDRSNACHTPLKKSHQVNSFQLRYLDLTNTILVDSQLFSVLQHCSNLIEVRVNTNLFPKPETQRLLLPSSLKLLDINGMASHHGVQSLQFERLKLYLKDIGRNLTSLLLSNVNGIKFSALSYCCSTLKLLVLSHCNMVVPFNQTTKEHSEGDSCELVQFSAFSQLQSIKLEKLSFNPHEQRSKLLFHILSSHSELFQLSLKTVPIEEECLLRILQTSSGVQLRKVVLSCYDNITAQTIPKLAEMCPSLVCLELFHCWVITWSDVWQINDTFRRKGRKLEVITPEQNELIF